MEIHETQNIKKKKKERKIFKQKNKVGKLTNPNFKTYYKVTVIKTVCYQHEDRHMDHMKQNSEKDPHTHKLFFTGCQDHSVVKDNLFNKWCCKNHILTHKRMKLNPYEILYTKINSRWIKGINVRFKRIKLLEKKL